MCRYMSAWYFVSSKSGTLKGKADISTMVLVRTGANMGVDQDQQVSMLYISWLLYAEPFCFEVHHMLGEHYRSVYRRAPITKVITHDV